MSVTRIGIDDDTLGRDLALSGARTRREAVNLALRCYADQHDRVARIGRHFERPREWGARAVLGDTMSPYSEVRYAGIRLAECLGDALRVAESRGMRLPYVRDEAGCESEDATGGHGPDPSGPTHS